MKEASSSGFELTIPAGSLGLALKGNPTTITQIQETSPLAGQVQVGDVISSLILEDGTEVNGLDTPQLIEALAKTSNEINRTLVIDPSKIGSSSSSILELDIPAGSLGIALSGDPPRITNMSPQSPLAGEVQEGDVISTVIMGDGTEMSNLDVQELVRLLEETKDDPDRTIIVDTSAIGESPSASTMELMLPAGKLGIALKGDPAVVSGIADGSPLAGDVQEGDVIACLVLGDGTKMADLGAMELTSVLQDTERDPDRKLILDMDNVAASSSTMEINIPAGSLGIALSGDPPRITNMSPQSPLTGQVQEGDVISTLIMGDGTEMSNLDVQELVRLLEETKDDPDRTIIVDTSALGESPSASTMELMLPAGKLGIALKGDPAVVSGIADGSPLAGDVQEGDVIACLVLGDGTKLSDLGAMELTSLLQKTEGDPDRKLILDMGNVPAGSSVEINLPPGKLYIALTGNPAEISKISPNSPIFGLVNEGDVVKSLVLDDGTVLEGLGNKELVEALDDSINDMNRKLVMEGGEDTTRVLELNIPAGSLNIALDGNPAAIAKIAKNSPLKGKVHVGDIISSLTLGDGSEFTNLGAMQLREALGRSSDDPNRKLVIKLIGVDEPLSGVSSSSMEIDIPPGPLKIALLGDPATIKDMAYDSPLYGLAQIGDVISSLVLGDGSVLTGLDSQELTAAISKSASDSNRRLIFGSKTPSRTSLSLNLPSSSTKLGFALNVSIPSGSLKIALKGNPPEISNIGPDSPLVNQVQVGDIVTGVILGDGTKLSGLDTQELIKTLNASASDSNRQLVITDPPDSSPAADNTYQLKVPAGSLKIEVKGSPPIISELDDESPLCDHVELGYVIKALNLGDGSIIRPKSARELAKALSDSSRDSNRILEIEKALPATSIITIDSNANAGALNIVDDKDGRPVLMNVIPGHPLEGELCFGMNIHKVALKNGEKIVGHNSKEIKKFLRENSTKRRIITLKNPSKPFPKRFFSTVFSSEKKKQKVSVVSKADTSGDVGYWTDVSQSGSEDKIVLSEVLYNEPGGATWVEWIRAYNPTNKSVDISGWKLIKNRGMANSAECTLDYGSVIGDKESFIFGHAETFEKEYGFNPDATIDYVLTNKRMLLTLTDEKGRVIDEVGWGRGPWSVMPKAGDGHSIIRVDENSMKPDAWKVNTDPTPTGEKRKDLTAKYLWEGNNLSEWFDYYDTNNSGQLSKEEVADALLVTFQLDGAKKIERC